MTQAPVDLVCCPKRKVRVFDHLLFRRKMSSSCESTRSERLNFGGWLWRWKEWDLSCV